MRFFTLLLLTLVILNCRCNEYKSTMVRKKFTTMDASADSYCYIFERRIHNSDNRIECVEYESDCSYCQTEHKETISDTNICHLEANWKHYIEKKWKLFLDEIYSGKRSYPQAPACTTF